MAEDRYFKVDYVRLVRYDGGDGFYELEPDRTLFTHQEMDPDVYGPVRTIDPGGNRIWLKITNEDTQPRVLREVKLAVSQGNAQVAAPATQINVGVYSGYYGTHKTYVYTQPSSATLVLRVRGKTSVNGRVTLPYVSSTNFHKSATFGRDYWSPRPSDEQGNLFPDGDEADVPFYRVVLNKGLIIQPNTYVYLECACRWTLPVPAIPLPEGAGPTAQWGYVFQWFYQGKNSCKAKMYDAGPSPEPEPPTPLPAQDVSVVYGQGGTSGTTWKEGFDRFLMDHVKVTTGGTVTPYIGAWTDAKTRPALKLKNTVGRSVYIKNFKLAVINGSTDGSSMTVRTKSVAYSTKIEALPAQLKIKLRGTDRIWTKAIVATAASELRVSTTPDASYWRYRPSDASGRLYPDGSSSNVIFYSFTFTEPLHLEADEEVFLDFECTWPTGNHVLQWYPENSFHAPARLQLTWDANGGVVEGSSSVKTYPLLGTSLTSEDIPTPTRSGYRFLGWDPTPDTSGETTVQTNKTYTAKWKQISGGLFRCYEASTGTWYPIIMPMVYNASTYSWESLNHAKVYRDGQWVTMVTPS